MLSNDLLTNLKAYQDFDDEKLIRLFQEGDEKSYEVIYSRYYKRIFLYIKKYYWFGDGEVEDICQDIMLSIYKNIKNFEFRSKFSTYLFSACLNHVRTKLRNNKKRGNTVSLDQSFGYGDGNSELTLSDYLYDEKQDIEQEYIDKELQIILREAVYQLPDENKEVYILREFEKMSFNEIIKITGFSMRKLHYLKENADSFLKTYFSERNINLN